MQQDPAVLIPMMVGAFVIVNFVMRMVMLAVKLGIAATLVWAVIDIGPQFMVGG